MKVYHEPHSAPRATKNTAKKPTKQTNKPPVIDTTSSKKKRPVINTASSKKKRKIDLSELRADANETQLTIDGIVISSCQEPHKNTAMGNTGEGTSSDSDSDSDSDDSVVRLFPMFPCS